MMASGRFTERERSQHELPGIAGGRLNVPANSNIQAVWKLNEIELRHNLEGEASWHWQYRNSSYIYIGGLDVRLTEGDIIVVFSQWGEPIDIHLVRDKRTGVPKGFAFLAYEDQRSTILAVDNANGMQLLQHTLRVDHCKHYRPPEREKSQERETNGDTETTYEATGAEGKGLGVYGVTRDQQKRFAAEKQAQQLLQQNRLQENKRAVALQRQGMKDVDEMWCEEFEEMLQQINREAEAEAQQQLEAEAAQRRRRQKAIEKQAKKEWKREWKQQRAAQKKKKKGGQSGGESSADGSEYEKKKEKKKHKHRRADREKDEEQDTRRERYNTFEGKKGERGVGGSERRELHSKEYDGTSREQRKAMHEQEERDEESWRRGRERVNAEQEEKRRDRCNESYREKEETRRRRSASEEAYEKEKESNKYRKGEGTLPERSWYGGREREKEERHRGREREEKENKQSKGEQRQLSVKASTWSREVSKNNIFLRDEEVEDESYRRGRERPTSEEGRQQQRLDRRRKTGRTLEDDAVEQEKGRGGKGDPEQQHGRRRIRREVEKEEEEEGTWELKKRVRRENEDEEQQQQQTRGTEKTEEHEGFRRGREGRSSDGAAYA